MTISVDHDFLHETSSKGYTFAIVTLFVSDERLTKRNILSKYSRYLVITIITTNGRETEMAIDATGLFLPTRTFRSPYVLWQRVKSPRVQLLHV